MAGQPREQQLSVREFDLASSGFGRNENRARARDADFPLQVHKRRRPVAAGQVLVRTVEAEIIPRLVLSHREANRLADAPDRASSCRGEVAEFAAIILGGDMAEACSSIDAMRASGQSLEQIYLDLMEPAAQRLGDLWNADACDFVAVTVGIMRLQQILHEFGLAFRREAEPREHGHRALLIPAPGEKESFGHLMFGTFGLAMAAEFLRRDGWDAYVDSSASSEEAATIARREWFDVVEISLSDESHIAELATGIRQIRRASRNRAIGVIVSGPVLRNHPEMTRCVGADAAATDGRQAAMQADDLMELLRRR
jgi:methylmalonyl-CoA mutase cobalamin-binding subunit